MSQKLLEPSDGAFTHDDPDRATTPENLPIRPPENLWGVNRTQDTHTHAIRVLLNQELGQEGEKLGDDA